MEVDAAIEQFWDWWRTARERVVHAIEVEKAFSKELVEDISRHVEAIGDLDWELCPGKTAAHGFCLSSKGDPEARLITELWRHRGPPPDATWEYFAARQAGRGDAIKIAGVHIKFAEFVVAFEVDEGRERVDARYFHPLYAHLSQDLRNTVLFLMLDDALGEDGVERWIGGVEVVEAAPEGGVPRAEFMAAVDELKRVATGERFAVMQGETEDGEPLFATVNRALKRIDNIAYTTHLAVDLVILDRNSHGLTTSADAEVLNALQDDLCAALGSLAVYFGRETRRGHRIIHWYTPADSGAQGIVDRWIAAHPDRKPNAEWIHDPAWEFVQRYA